MEGLVVVKCCDTCCHYERWEVRDNLYNVWQVRSGGCKVWECWVHACNLCKHYQGVEVDEGE